MSIRDAEYMQGLTEAEPKILKFLLQKCPLDDADTEQSFTIRLKKVLGVGNYEFIDDWDLDFGDNHEDVIKDILDKVEADAENHKGKVKYAISVDGKDAVCKFTITVPKAIDDDGDDYDDFEDEYEPSKKGIIGHLLKHESIKEKQSNKQTKEIIEFYKEELRSKNQRIRELEARENQVSKTIADLHDASHIRAYEWKKLEKEDERKDKTVDMLMSWSKVIAPVVTTKLMGGGIQMASEMINRSPGEAMLESLFESFTDQQKAQFYAMLKAEQQYTVSQILQYFMDRKQKEEEMKKAGPQNPFVGANGASPPPSNGGPASSSTHTPFSNIKL